MFVLTQVRTRKEGEKEEKKTYMEATINIHYSTFDVCVFTFNLVCVPLSVLSGHILLICSVF